MPRTTRFDAIGTHWQIRLGQPVNNGVWQALLKKLHRRIGQFDADYSRFRADSLVSRMAQRAGRYELPADGYELLDMYHRLYQVSQSRVTPLIGQAVSDAGYDAAYSFRSRPLQRPPAWQDVIRYDQHSISLSQPALLDFGAAGKGYLVDILGDIIEDSGIGDYVINAGGDIRQRSTTNQALMVGLESPLDSTEVVGVLPICNQSLCASSGSKRAWGKYHHIIDPVALDSPRKTLASWVLASDTMTADGLATALFFCPAAELHPHFSFDYAVLTDDMQLTHSTGFGASLFGAPAGAAA